MPVTVICDNCNKNIGDFVWEQGFSAGLKEGTRHVSCRRESSPNGMLVACSRECAIALDLKFPKNKAESEQQGDDGLDREFGHMGVA